MYLSFYGLQQKPFQISTNPSFIWLGKLHQKVLAMLQYGILQNQGFLVLTGDVGTGKTTLVNALIDSLGDDVVVAKVPDPGLELIDFLNYIAHAFGMDNRFVCKEDFLIHFDLFLQNSADAGKKVLLIIDEAQRLNVALLEEIRQLSNIEKQQTKVLNILFSGQNLFNDFLQESQNRALAQRIAINVTIGPLNLDETAEYIRQSLVAAGAEKAIFSADALRSVYQFSGGFLRRINIICDHAMLLGYLQSKKTVTADMVRQCAEDICLPDATVQLPADLLRGVDSYDEENVQDIPPVPVPESAPIQAWKIIGTVILIVIGVFWATYYNYPQEYQTLFSRILPGMKEQSMDDEMEELPAAIETVDFVKIQPVEENGVADVQPSSAQMNALSFSEQKMSKEADVSESISTLTDDMPVPYTKAEEDNEGNEVSQVSETIEAIAPVEIPAQSVDGFVAEDETIGSDPSPVAAGVSFDEKQRENKNIENIEKSETASAAYARVVNSLIEKMTDDMTRESVEPTTPEKAEEAVEAVEVMEEPPADVDPGAVIDWVIKKRSE